MKDSSLPYFRADGLPDLTCSICGVSQDKMNVFPFPKGATPAAACLPCWMKYDADREAMPYEPRGPRVHGTPAEPWVPHVHKDVYDLDLDQWVSTQLKAIGLEPNEIGADLERVPPLLLEEMPKAILDALKVGKLPPVGCGLAGIPGGGKTQALAAILRLSLTNNFRNTIAREGLKSVSKVSWANWPVTAAQWRLRPLEDDISNQFENYSQCRLLVLDDLGREAKRSGSDYTEDRVTSLLDSIVTIRDRKNLPVLWTTNVGEDALIRRYGASMWRRLTRINPLITLEGLRLFPVAKP